MNNPEEINRICVDHVSKLLLAGVQSACCRLEHEGLSERCVLMGDPMYDAFLAYGGKRSKADVRLKTLDGETVSVPEKYLYMTCHREENTGNDNALTEILATMEEVSDGAAVIYPVHPRNRESARRLRDKFDFKSIIFVEPVGYFESLCLTRNAEKIVTGSDGLQREAFFAGKKCVTVFDYVIHPETMTGRRNEIVRPNRRDIVAKLNTPQQVDTAYLPYGDGHSGRRIVAAMEKG